MSDNPIVVSAKPFNTSGTVRGPIVVTPQEGDSGDTTPRVGYNQLTYKVKLVANGKTFHMLLPPSIESKHPGRANPLQLPGLQIKAGINISKLKIPGFFPIYQNLGVETLTVSMSGMFTGYDGVNSLAAANWENAVGIGQSSVQQGQDSFASASELYDFAVNSKALVQVTIYTSDGSFIPKKSTSTTFRDSNSNISFKGYIKEFEHVYIRQDRNYYMLKFEIIDFGSNNKCKVEPTKKTTNKTNDLLPTIGSCIDKLDTVSIKNIQTVLKNKGMYLGPINGQMNAILNLNLDSIVKDKSVTADSSCRFLSGNYINTSLSDLLNTILDNPPPNIQPNINYSNYEKIPDILNNSPNGQKLKDLLNNNNGVLTGEQLSIIGVSPKGMYVFKDFQYKFSGIVVINEPPNSNPPQKDYITFTSKDGALLYLVPNDTTNSSFSLKLRLKNEFL